MPLFHPEVTTDLPDCVFLLEDGDGGNHQAAEGEIHDCVASVGSGGEGSRFRGLRLVHCQQPDFVNAAEGNAHLQAEVESGRRAHDGWPRWK